MIDIPKGYTLGDAHAAKAIHERVLQEETLLEAELRERQDRAKKQIGLLAKLICHDDLRIQELEGQELEDDCEEAIEAQDVLISR